MRLLYLCVVAVATALSIRTLERDKTFHLLACACAWASPLLLSWSGFLFFFYVCGVFELGTCSDLAPFVIA
jgi:hypothetical protein